MSTYKFKLSKRYIVARDDSSAWSPDQDSTIDSTQQQDIAVSLYLDDELKHTVTVTDAGATLEFTQTIAQGAHTIRIVPAKDPIQHTDVCVDQLIIDDVTTQTTQWDYNNQIDGTASTLRQLLAYPNHQPHSYIWYGNTIANDSTLNLEGPFYRPTIVAAHQSEWVWDFNITASGKIWFQDSGDITDMLYDSTAQHTYYLCAVTDSQETIRTWYDGMNDSTVESHALYQGAGTYYIDSNNYLEQASDSVDESAEDANSVVLYSVNEHTQFTGCYQWHQNNSMTVITIT